MGVCFVSCPVLSCPVFPSGGRGQAKWVPTSSAPAGTGSSGFTGGFGGDKGSGRGSIRTVSISPGNTIKDVVNVSRVGNSFFRKAGVYRLRQQPRTLSIPKGPRRRALASHIAGTPYEHAVDVLKSARCPGPAGRHRPRRWPPTLWHCARIAT